MSAFLSPVLLMLTAAADGGSNTGGAVLKQFFSADKLHTLSKQINPILSSGTWHFGKDAAWQVLLTPPYHSFH